MADIGHYGGAAALLWVLYQILQLVINKRKHGNGNPNGLNEKVGRLEEKMEMLSKSQDEFQERVDAEIVRLRNDRHELGNKISGYLMKVDMLEQRMKDK